METKQEKDKAKTEVFYYGKKRFYFDPMIARKQQFPENVPDYSNEQSQSISERDKR